jgi:SAM-dependent methyltransferase
MPDVFGKVMRDAARGIPGVHIVERDDGFERESSIEQYVWPFERWADHPEGLALEYVKGSVLDIGCGAGRVALHLQNMGFDVTGIDISPGAIEVCREQGLKKAYVMPVEDLDFPDNTFDTILLFGNNFGLLGTDDLLITMLQKLQRITREDAVVLAGTICPTDTDNPRHLKYHEKNRSEGRPPGLVRLRLKYNGETGDWFDLRLAQPEEMQYVAERAGWSFERKIGDFGYYVGVLRKR